MNMAVENSTSFFNMTEDIGIELLPFVLPFTDRDVFVSGVILTVLFFFGTVLNIIVIVVILLSPSLKRKSFMQFILSLSVSDLLAALWSPLFWYLHTHGYNHFALPGIFCKMSVSIFYVTTVVTNLHILTITALRYRSLRNPFKVSTLTLKQAKMAIAILWGVSIVAGFSTGFIFFQAHHRDRNKPAVDRLFPSCSVSISKMPVLMIYGDLFAILFSYIPLSGVVLLSLMILCKIRSRSNTEVDRLRLTTEETERRQRRQKNLTWQLLVVMIGYLIGYFPLPKILFAVMKLSVTDPSDTKFYFSLIAIEYLLLRLSECLNPILYNIGSKEMRNSTIIILTCKKSKLQNKERINSNLSSATFDTLLMGKVRGFRH